MTDSFKKASIWHSLWWSKQNTPPESPETGGSRGSRRERLRRALSLRFRSMKHKTEVFKRPTAALFLPSSAPPRPNTLSSGISYQEKPMHQSSTGNEVLANLNSQAHLGHLDHDTEQLNLDLLGMNSNLLGANSEGPFSGSFEKLASDGAKQDHTLLKRIRLKWLAPDQIRPVAFLHEMRPGVTTTEVSYANA